jgi:hypothetical protein
MTKYFFAGALLLLMPGVVLAHGDGASFEAEAGDYLVDIGYDPAEPVGGNRMLFDFGLLAGGEPAAFDRLWVRLEHNGELVLAGPISRMPLGPTTLTVRMPEQAGQLTVHARFERGSETLAEASFPLSVAAAPQVKTVRAWWPLAAGVLLAAAGFLYGRRSVAA